jgi:molybdopterin molybdotransferase
MLSVSAAHEQVSRHAAPLPPTTAALDAAALGLVLAEDVASDLDMPPFDKSLMDGYAVRAGDLKDGRAVLTVIEEVTAGQTPTLSLSAGQATRIMTGAPIPTGADAVVMIERTKMLDDRRVEIEEKAPAKSGQNILPRAHEMRQGQVVVKAGARLRPQEFGVLASVGRTSALVHPAPVVAILSTGDELVHPHQKPGPGQIRNGNSPMLLAQVCRAGGVPRLLDIARDRVEHLRSLITDGLHADILLLSGGVSAGKLDLVPGVLADVGVEPHFHKVEMKPGKPIFFGTWQKDDRKALVFGLPGNPVSSLVCFELFVRPAIARLCGLTEACPCMIQAALQEDFNYRTDRPTYYPGSLSLSATGYEVRPVAWFGSADLCGLLPANTFIFVPPGEHRFAARQSVPVLKVE